MHDKSYTGHKQSKADKESEFKVAQITTMAIIFWVARKRVVHHLDLSHSTQNI